MEKKLFFQKHRESLLDVSLQMIERKKERKKESKKERNKQTNKQRKNMWKQLLLLRKKIGNYLVVRLTDVAILLFKRFLELNHSDLKKRK